MSQDQSLPVLVQHILTANAVKAHTAAILHRFKQQMYFSIVSERFKMSHSHDRSCDRLLVCYPALTIRDGYAKSVSYHLRHDLQLHLSHDLDVYLTGCLIPLHL